MTFSGQLRLVAAPNAQGHTVLREQAFRAPFHLSKPYWDADAGVLHTQVVNPTAGILAGDRLESDIHVASGAALLVTTPSATRVFKMTDRSAESHQRFSVDAGGWLEVLPEPLVPHRGCTFRQHTAIDVADGGGLFFVDQLQPGRVAHGEAWHWQSLVIELDVRVAGELVLRERFAHSPERLREMAALFGTGETTCFANAVLLAPAAGDSPAWRAELAALHGDGVWCGVSALRRGGWTLRLVARDSVRLRDALRRARETLARYFPRLACDTRRV